MRERLFVNMDSPFRERCAAISEHYQEQVRELDFRGLEQTLGDAARLFLEYVWRAVPLDWDSLTEIHRIRQDYVIRLPEGEERNGKSWVDAPIFHCTRFDLKELPGWKFELVWYSPERQDAPDCLLGELFAFPPGHRDSSLSDCPPWKRSGTVSAPVEVVPETPERSLSEGAGIVKALLGHSSKAGGGKREWTARRT